MDGSLRDGARIPIAYTASAPSFPIDRPRSAHRKAVVNRSRPATISGLSHIAAQIDSTQNARRVQKSLADAQEKENLGRAYAANAGLLGLETAREKTKQAEHLARICGQATSCQIGVEMAASIFGTRQ